MPIYTYECPTHKRFECIQNISDRLSAVCPQCGVVCQQTFETNEFQAKTKYIPPMPATRKLGDSHKTPYKRKKWY